MDPQRRYYFPVTGYNFRLTNIACAILCAQLERGKDIIEERRAMFARYTELLQNIPGIGFQPVAEWAEPTPWLFCLTVDEKQYGQTRDELAALLADKGVETRPFFIPLHSLPPFREESRRRNELLPHTDRLAASGLNLPTYSGLKDEEIEYIAGVIREASST
jgi:perosamine synthetase